MEFKSKKGAEGAKSRVHTPGKPFYMSTKASAAWRMAIRALLGAKSKSNGSRAPKIRRVKKGISHEYLQFRLNAN